MAFTLAEVARELGADLFGDGAMVIHGAAEPAVAGPTDLALAMDPKYAPGLAEGNACVAILWDGADWAALGLKGAIVVPRPRYAMSGLTKLMDPGPEIASGVHPSAVVDPSAVIGNEVAIGPLVVIGARAVIENGARIASHTSIGADAKIGPDALIHAGCRIGPRVRIGARFIAQPGAVIGSDGFSFVTPEKSRVEEARGSLGKETEAQNNSWTRIHSLGGVDIGNDVEVGANVTIDRGTIRATKIGNRTKLDNLVHIAHNVEIGDDVLLCGQVGIAGSTKIGNRVVFGGQVGVGDNLTIGDDVVAGGASKIMTRVPEGRVVLGYPAMKMDQFVQAGQNWRRLPKLIEDVRTLKKAVSKPDIDD